MRQRMPTATVNFKNSSAIYFVLFAVGAGWLSARRKAKLRRQLATWDSYFNDCCGGEFFVEYCHRVLYPSIHKVDVRKCRYLVPLRILSKKVPALKLAPQSRRHGCVYTDVPHNDPISTAEKGWQGSGRISGCPSSKVVSLFLSCKGKKSAHGLMGGT